MPYPYPSRPRPWGGAHDPFRGPDEVPLPGGAQNPEAPIGYIPPEFDGTGGGAPGQGKTGNWKADPIGEDNFYGGQQIAGADPAMADYGSVQNYSDQAYDAARRYIDPQQELDRRRFDQQIINKGLDPFSPAGEKMRDQLSRQLNDQNNAASFGALQFGQGIQNQMAQQELQKSQLAGDMQKALWSNNTTLSGQNLQKYLGDQQTGLGYAGLQNQFQIQQMANELQKYGIDQTTAVALANQQLQKYGMDQNFALGQSGQDLQRYGMDLGHQLGMGQLDLSRQGQDFSQMMGLEGLDFRNQVYGDSRSDYQDSIIMEMLGMMKPATAPGADPSGAFGDTIASADRDGGTAADIGTILGLIGSYYGTGG